MTKPLSKEDKKKRKEARKQRKAKSAAIAQPKVETPPGPPEAVPAIPTPVNLCDDCAYEFGECEGVPKFAQEEGVDDRVVECPAFVNVEKMPTADKAAPGPAAADEAALGLDLLETQAQGEIIREEEKVEERAASEADLEKRKKTQRFFREEDFGPCQSCGQPLKRTALNRDLDAVRCVNGRCRQYRFIIRTISTGV